MPGEIQTHKTDPSVVVSSPAEFEVGADVALKVKVTCESGCDLKDEVVRVLAQDGTVVKEVKLTTHEGTVSQTDEFMVKMPPKVGANMWKVVFPASEKAGVKHKEGSAPLAFIVKPHATSLAVLDAPDPVAIGADFKIKVGVKCSHGCKLSGRDIEVYDVRGEKVASGRVGDIQSAKPASLWVAEVTAKGPVSEGRYRWTVRFLKSDLEPPHEGTFRTFDFGVGGATECLVTVEVTDNETKAPVPAATVLLRPTLYRGYAYSSTTNDGGVARLSVDKEEYQLYVAGGGKEYFRPIVNVEGNMTFKVEIITRDRPPWEW